MYDPEIVIIGAAIIDVLARPVSAKVFETGSYLAEEYPYDDWGGCIK